MRNIDCVKFDTPIRGCDKHSHTMWEVILNLSGYVKSTIGGASYDIAPGDIMVIPPYVEHDGISDGYYSDMFFQTDEIDFHNIVIVHDHDNTVLNLMNILHKVCTEKDYGYTLIAGSLVNTISLFIKKLSKQNNHPQFLENLKDRIYENISNSDFNISEEIKKIGYNYDYLRRLFKNEFDETPLEYITRLRINQAKVLLVQDNFRGVGDVSRQCGFSDSFYFSSCFKKHTGLSPLQYRKNSGVG